MIGHSEMRRCIGTTGLLKRKNLQMMKKSLITYKRHMTNLREFQK